MEASFIQSSYRREYPTVIHRSIGQRRPIMTFGNRITLAIVAFLLCLPGVVGSEKDVRVYEMRTYYATPGKLDALVARFRDHTTKLFEKHRMTNIGYWVPDENPANKLIYILA